MRRFGSVTPCISDIGLVQQWREKLAQLTGYRIGVVWKGSATHTNDQYRSLPSLDALAPPWSVPDVSFVSLQNGTGEDEVASLSSSQPMLHLGADTTNFADSASIVEQPDLVICVDTSIAHRAGSLGKPCWVLFPNKGTDWRWMHERVDSLWYPGTMRLFRQSATGDWATTIEQVRLACLESFPVGSH
jgi:hypothetical protein